MPKPLTLVKKFDRVINGPDGIAQVSILNMTISGVDSGWLDGDELLSIL